MTIDTWCDCWACSPNGKGPCNNEGTINIHSVQEPAEIIVCKYCSIDCEKCGFWDEDSGR